MSLRGSASVLLLCLVALFTGTTGCSSNRKVERTPPPDWVSTRPLSGSHYIGIGTAPVAGSPDEAMKTAKERAAADLAAEIAVKVESTSLLQSTDDNGRISERFNSSISSRAQERISGFEVAGVWEDEARVYVYYRLNKARHAADREARRQEAIGSATLDYAAGKTALSEGKLLNALDHWSHGVMALEEFWNDVNRTTVDGTEVNLESHLIRTMRRTLADIRIAPVVDQVELNASNRFRFPLGLHATLDGRDLAGVPIAYKYHNGTYRKTALEFTDEAGLVVALISGVAPRRPDQDLEIAIDLDRIWKQTEVDGTIADLVGNPVLDARSLPIVVVMPSVFVSIQDGAALGAPLTDGAVQAMRAALMASGFSMVETVDSADFTVSLDLRSDLRTPSGNYGDFHTAYVQGSIAVRDRGGQLRKEVLVERTKGVQLDSDAALRLALSNTAESIEKILGKKVSAALQ